MTKKICLSEDKRIACITTQNGYTISCVLEIAPKGIVQFGFNDEFKFSIPLEDLLEFVATLTPASAGKQEVK